MSNFKFTEAERDECYTNLISYNTNQIKSKELIDRIETLIQSRADAVRFGYVVIAAVLIVGVIIGYCL